MKLAAPTVQRIVVTVNDVDGHIALGKTLHLTSKCDQRTQAAVLRIVEVSGKHQKIRVRLNRVIDNTLERAERRGLQFIAKFRRGVRQSPERTVEVQIGSMDKA